MGCSELSYEMMMEIVSRASLPTLDMMRCTSKELNALGYESYLLDLYKKRNKIVSGFVMQTMPKGCWKYINEFAPSPGSSNIDLGFLPHNARILASSEQGIIVFQTRDPINAINKLHVCKPTTKQILELPDPKGNYTVQKCAIVVMSSNPLHYKIIMFSSHPVTRRWRKFYTTYRCDIFDSRTSSREWRSLKPVTLPYCVFLTNPQPITNRGSIYMLLTNNDILEMDAYSEKWKVFSSPVESSSTDDEWFSCVELVKYGGRLGLACKPSNGPKGCWEFWVLSKDQTWENTKYVCKKKKGSWESLRALYDLDTSVMLDRNTLMYYKFKQEEGDNMINKVVLSDTPCRMFSFRSDFEPVDLS